eukprot:scaffold3031_cov126-Isochrysis_galbana.AAC.1
MSCTDGGDGSRRANTSKRLDNVCSQSLESQVHVPRTEPKARREYARAWSVRPAPALAGWEGGVTPIDAVGTTPLSYVSTDATEKLGLFLFLPGSWGALVRRLLFPWSRAVVRGCRRYHVLIDDVGCCACVPGCGMDTWIHLDTYSHGY